MSENELEHLEKLHDLHEKKVISTEEYENKKQQIMNQASINTERPKQTQKSFIFAVVSVVLGGLTMLFLVSPGLWTLDDVIGGFMLSITGIVFGVLSFKGQKEKNKIGIVGVILSGLATLFLLFVDYYDF